MTHKNDDEQRDRWPRILEPQRRGTQWGFRIYVAPEAEKREILVRAVILLQNNPRGGLLGEANSSVQGSSILHMT